MGEQRIRFEWMDTLRGLAVILVVFYHAALSVDSAGQDPPTLAIVVNDAFAPYRMPLLVFLSGMLLSRSLEKPAGSYLWGKASNIAWPYFLWVIPQFFIHPPGEHWRGFLAGGTYLWFLLFIGSYYVIAYLTKRVQPIAVAAVAMAIAVIAPDGSKFGERLFFLLAIFMLGSWFAAHPKVVTYIFASQSVLVASIAAIISYHLIGPGGGYQPVSTLATLGGIILLARLSKTVSHLAFTRPLREAGKDSIIVYIMHVVGMQLVGLAIGADSQLPAWELYPIFLVAGLLTATLTVYGARHVLVIRYLFTLTPRRAPRAKAHSGARRVMQA